MFATLISIIQYSLMAIVIFGDTIFGILGLPKEALKPVQDSKWMYLLGTLFVGN